MSAYALTIEPKTALESLVKKNIIKPLDEDLVFEQHEFMCEKMSTHEYINYELSSFAKKGYFSKNNSAYLGIYLLFFGIENEDLKFSSKKWMKKKSSNCSDHFS